MKDCPCGSGRAYANCCGRYHAGEAEPSAEALMRSRYSAYVLKLVDYLRATWHPDTCPADLDLDSEPAPKWLGLDVRRHQQTDVDHATVEFVARWREAGKGRRLHETSRFVRNGEGRWVYVDGVLHGTTT